ncbi:unnamed protein product [Symbiodinium sp. KB8]|nr:unnamed protein product [Symbiodinium sp. KB8]
MVTVPTELRPPTALVTSSALESRWSCSGRSCLYTLPSFGAIWAGSWVDIWVTLSNPASPLKAQSPDNVWQLRMQAAGYHTTSVLAPVVPFSQSHLHDADVELRAGVPVLGMLSHTSIQPSRFAASPANGSLVPNELQVLFMPEQSVWAGRLVLQMPDGFTVPSTNICSDLHPSLHSADGEGRRVLVLPGIWSCAAESRSRLSIALAGALLAGKYYGFQAQVFNPRNLLSSQEPWVLMTVSGQGYPVDASAAIGLSAPGAEDGFEVYERELTESNSFSRSVHVSPWLLTLTPTAHAADADGCELAGSHLAAAAQKELCAPPSSLHQEANPQKFLDASELLSVVQQVGIADWSYRQAFTENYRVLFQKSRHLYRVELWEACQGDFESVAVKGGIYVTHGSSHLKASDVRHCHQRLLAKLEDKHGEPTRTDSCRFLEQLSVLLGDFDTAWSDFEASYVAELMRIAVEARRPVERAVKLERQLQFCDKVGPSPSRPKTSRQGGPGRFGGGRARGALEPESAPCVKWASSDSASDSALCFDLQEEMPRRLAPLSSWGPDLELGFEEGEVLASLWLLARCFFAAGASGAEAAAQPYLATQVLSGFVEVRGCLAEKDEEVKRIHFVDPSHFFIFFRRRRRVVVGPIIGTLPSTGTLPCWVTAPAIITCCCCCIRPQPGVHLQLRHGGGPPGAPETLGRMLEYQDAELFLVLHRLVLLCSLSDERNAEADKSRNAYSRLTINQVQVAAVHGDRSRPLVSMEVVYPAPSEQDRIARVQVLLTTGSVALTDGPWKAMGDTKWGFGTNYAHRTLPFKWHHAGYSYYDQNSSLKTTFRPTSMPAYRDDFLPLDTNYKEREQNNRWAMSCYGCHRNPAWHDTLRAPRNPFAGSKLQEMRYMREFGAKPSSAPTTPRRAEPQQQTHARACSTSRSTPRRRMKTEDVFQASHFGKWAD